MSKENFFEKNKEIGAIFVISLLGLFLEMLLIRWIGVEIRIFAYLQNTILVACFVGLGIGFFTSKQSVELKKVLYPLTFLLILMAIPASKEVLGRISEFLSVLGDMLIWGQWGSLESFNANLIFVSIGLILTYIVLILIIDIFVPIGRLLGHLMDNSPNIITAYSVNIAGSLVGTWLFVLMSYFYQPPFTWYLVFGILMLVLIFWSKKDVKRNIMLIGLIIVLSWFSNLEPKALEVIWSPYQKLVVEKIDEEVNDEYLVTVNNTGYQTLVNLSEEHINSNIDRFPTEIQQGLSQYDITLLLHPNPQSLLIVGAGAGNNAAGGLRHGVNDITAVEIDPAIIEIGRNYHPEHPYSSPNVNVVQDDARSFFSVTSEKYDVISFGLLDSHTTTAMTNARLDHYVYTKESISRAKSLLADGGIMVLSFEAQKPYISDRIASVLLEIFGEKPMAFRVRSSKNVAGGVVFVAGDMESAKRQIDQNQNLKTYLEELEKEYPLSLTYTTKITTDDWPYIYLETPKIPVLYYLLAGLMLLAFYHTTRKWQATGFTKKWKKSHWHFFFLGFAFLLLEVQNISKASVVLGNTWETSAVIISGVLTMVLLANWVVYKFKNISITPVYIVLIGIAIALYFVDLAQFAFLPYAIKALVVGSLTTFPMLFSGIIFTKSFSLIEEKDEALGANMIGSLVGALMQSVTFVIGIKALLLIVAGAYLLSMLTRVDKA